MALSPQQLQALFQGESSGNQGAFASATPDMDQGQRNQYINQYGVGGTGYGDFLKWYGGGRQMPGAGTTGGPTGANFAANPGPQMQTPQNPTGPSTKIGNQNTTLMGAGYGQPGGPPMVNPTGPGFQASMSPWQQQAGGMQQAIGAYAGNGQGAMGRQGYVDPNLGNFKPQASYNVPQNQNLMGQGLRTGANLGGQTYQGQGMTDPNSAFRNQIYGNQGSGGDNPANFQPGNWHAGNPVFDQEAAAAQRMFSQGSGSSPQSGMSMNGRMGYGGGTQGFSEFNPQRRSSPQGYTINPMMYRGWNIGR